MMTIKTINPLALQHINPMNLETLRTFCLSLPGTTEDLPFGPEVLVFRIGGKIYLLISLNEPNRFNVKCEPQKAIELREEFEEVQPGFHMNKKHWNTVFVDGRIPQARLREMIKDSFQLVRNSLSAKEKKALDK